MHPVVFKTMQTLDIILNNLKIILASRQGQFLNSREFRVKNAELGLFYLEKNDRSWAMQSDRATGHRAEAKSECSLLENKYWRVEPTYRGPLMTAER